MSTLAQSTTKSSNTNRPTSRPRLELDAAARCLIQIGSKSYRLDDFMKVALCLLDGMAKETLSYDALYLSGMNALTLAKKKGIDEDTAKELLELLLTSADQRRRASLFANMF